MHAHFLIPLAHIKDDNDAEGYENTGRMGESLRECLLCPACAAACRILSHGLASPCAMMPVGFCLLLLVLFSSI